MNGGRFLVAVSIAGSSAAQNLISLENPSQSGRAVFVTMVWMTGAASGLATAFEYTLTRTTATPSGGSTVAPLRREAVLAPAAVTRTNPTATAAAEVGKRVTPGSVVGLSVTGPLLPYGDGFKARDDDSAIRLEPGEALLVKASANGTTWTHIVELEWAESITG